MSDEVLLKKINEIKSWLVCNGGKDAPKPNELSSTSDDDVHKRMLCNEPSTSGCICSQK